VCACLSLSLSLSLSIGGLLLPPSRWGDTPERGRGVALVLLDCRNPFPRYDNKHVALQRLRSMNCLR
jgi:hypothetical protein